jgi:hypothetical protein
MFEIFDLNVFLNLWVCLFLIMLIYFPEKAGEWSADSYFNFKKGFVRKIKELQNEE